MREDNYPNDNTEAGRRAAEAAEQLQKAVAELAASTGAEEGSVALDVDRAVQEVPPRVRTLLALEGVGLHRHAVEGRLRLLDDFAPEGADAILRTFLELVHTDGLPVLDAWEIAIDALLAELSTVSPAGALEIRARDKRNRAKAKIAIMRRRRSISW